MIRIQPSRPRAFAALLTMAVLAASVPGPGPFTRSVRAADASADIPGVPLPGPISAGRLGGAVYDVVYRLAVEPGHVLVASVTGASGTDFDIYLFDDTATTVLSTQGLLTKATGPTSDESISWPSREGGVYYIDLNGATDVEGDYRLTVQTVPDPTPPVASVTLLGGRASTNQLSIPVTVGGTEDLSGLTEMAFSFDGVTFGPWLPFATATKVDVPAGDGSRTLWAKVRNGVGLESAPVADAITIDTVSPSVIAIDPSPGSSVSGLRPPIRVTFNEPINASTWTDLGLIVQSATGSLVPGTYSYDPQSRQATFAPLEALQPGAVYAVNVGLVRDLAGNTVAPLTSWSITPLTPTSLLATASHRVVTVGGASRINLTFSGPQQATSVEMLSSGGTGPFETVSIFELVDGSLSLLVAPVQNTTYRFRYGGAFGIAASQVDVRVLVRRSIVIAGRDSRVTARSRIGSNVRLTAAISPAQAGASVSFRMYRFDATRRSWVYTGSFGRKSDAQGRAVLNWTPSRAGSFYWRAIVGSTPEYANNTSPVYRWAISP